MSSTDPTTKSRTSESTKNSNSRPMILNTKFEVKRFDGTDNFAMWQCQVQDVLIQLELDIALEENKPEKYNDKECNRINKHVCCIIRLCVAKE